MTIGSECGNEMINEWWGMVNLKGSNIFVELCQSVLKRIVPANIPLVYYPWEPVRSRSGGILFPDICDIDL